MRWQMHKVMKISHNAALGFHPIFILLNNNRYLIKYKK
jgi:hypothetical protein